MELSERIRKWGRGLPGAVKFANEVAKLEAKYKSMLDAYNRAYVHLHNVIVSPLELDELAERVVKRYAQLEARLEFQIIANDKLNNNRHELEAELAGMVLMEAEAEQFADGMELVPEGTQAENKVLLEVIKCGATMGPTADQYLQKWLDALGGESGKLGADLKKERESTKKISALYERAQVDNERLLELVERWIVCYSCHYPRFSLLDASEEATKEMRFQRGRVIQRVDENADSSEIA